jgi:hypothetical protein
MSNDHLYDIANATTTRADFLEFAERLCHECRNGIHQWENRSVPDYLDGLHGFAHAMGGYYQNMGEDVDIETISWRMVAHMLLAATVYEI